MSTAVLSPAARRDLLKIYVTGVEDFGEHVAAAFRTKFLHTLSLLASNPRMGTLAPRAPQSVRTFPHRPYVVVYVETANGIRVLRILHGRQNR